MHKTYNPRQIEEQQAPWRRVVDEITALLARPGLADDQLQVARELLARANAGLSSVTLQFDPTPSPKSADPALLKQLQSLNAKADLVLTKQRAETKARQMPTYTVPPPPEISGDLVMVDCYGWLWNQPGRSGTTYEPGALRVGHYKSASGVGVSYKHDPSNMLGRCTSVTNDGRGLRIQMALNPPRDFATQAIHNDLRAGRLGVSVHLGEPRSGFYDLTEVALTDQPDHPGARVLGVR